MKKYIIVIGENNQAVSAEVQRSLFKAGFEWGCYDNTVRNTSAIFLDINANGNGFITYSDDSSCARKRVVAGAGMLIPSDVIYKAGSLDGAVKPVKKMTVAEVIAELGYEIEITK